MKTIQASDLMPFKGALLHLAYPNKGKRRYPEHGSDSVFAPFLSNPFLMDAEIIALSKALRRQQSKAQTTSSPQNLHVRTRLSHSAEVADCAMLVASVLGLNVDLCRAIALGHDIGHTPFGHAGERFLNQRVGDERQFAHNIFGVVVAQHVERGGAGLNLCRETLQGILYHSRGRHKMSTGAPLPEHDLVMICDKIAYTLADINDAVRRGDIIDGGLNGEILKVANVFGANQRERTISFLSALIKESAENGRISFSKSKEARVFEALRQAMYKNVYPRVDWSIHELVLERIYEFVAGNPWFGFVDPAIVVALMTDNEARYLGQAMLNTEPLSMDLFRGLGLLEVLLPLKTAQRWIEFDNPDLDW